MATQRRFEHEASEEDEGAVRHPALEVGARPTDEAADKSPALALQAKLHSRLRPQTLELSSRFITLLFVLGLVGTWLATEAAYTTL
ncbi:MAG: hypothetical protein AAF613_07145 [Pseudomonadota bacterium]